MDPCYHVRHAIAVAVSLVVVASAATAAAQFMYLDANGDGVRTEADVFPSTGTATFDVWLVTDHNRDGTPATCAADPSAALTINSYSFILRATQGTVVWSNFVDRLLPQAYAAGGDSSSTEFWIGRAGITALAPGRYRLASLTATATFGSPSILVVPTSETMSGAPLTSFGSQCMGVDYDNTMKLGTDWFDADGLPFSSPGNGAPSLEPIPPLIVAEGSVLERALHATDPDGQALTFGMDGPSYASVTTTDPGTGSATGLLRVSPGYTDAGTTEAIVFATDGVSQAGSLLHLTVTDVNRAPALQPLAAVSVVEGQTATLPVVASDADGTTPLSLRIVSGPGFMSLSRVVGGMTSISADLVVRPGYSDEGSYTGVLAANDGMASDTESFPITVTNGNQPPIIPEYLPDVSVVPGTLASVDVSATDPEGAPLTFSEFVFSQPIAFMTVLTIDPGHGTGLGRVELRPTLADVGDHTARIKVSDGTSFSYTTMGVQVPDPNELNAPPVLNPIANMVAVEGDSVSQVVHASDPEGNWLQFTPISFFPFMRLTDVTRGATETTARIVMAPRPGDRGQATVGVRVSDGMGESEQSFQVTVLEPRAGSTMFLLHRDPAPSDEWTTLQFRTGEGSFTRGGDHGTVAVAFVPPPPKPDGTAWGPAVQLACLPAQRPHCLSEPINNWTFWFQPPLGQTFTAGVTYDALPVADSTHAAFVAHDYCSFRSPPSARLEIRQVQAAADGTVTSFWATARHDPDGVSGLFEVELRYAAQLPVSIDAPSRMEAHAQVALEVPLRIGGYAAGSPTVTSPDLPAGAAITISNDSTALFRWTPDWGDKGLHSLRFIAQRAGTAPDTCLMTTCVDIPGETTAVVDANRLQAIVTNRGSTSDVWGNGPGFIYPRGSGIAVGSSAGLLLSGVVDGSVRIARPVTDYHAGPVESGTAPVFRPEFKNYTIRRGSTSDYDWVHWPTQLGAPIDASGGPLLLGDETVWSVYNDAPALWESPPSSREALGLEIRQTSWSMADPGAVGSTVYQAFRLRNVGTSPIQELYAAVQLDPVTWETGGGCVAYPNRDQMGCDTTSGLAYAYSRDDWVARNAIGVLTLGPEPRPAAVQDQRDFSPQGVHNQLQGLNPDGTPRHERDDPALPITPYAYTGDPLLQSGWLYAGRYGVWILASAGPFDLAPGAEQEVRFAIVAAEGLYPLDALRRLRITASEIMEPPVPPPDRPPAAEAGGPYSGFAGTPVTFDGSGSSDPDGDALVYTWRFGDGAIGSGVQPLHTYTAAGRYPVRLSVFDAHLGTEDSTAAQIAPVDSAAALLTASGPAVRLQSARPTVRISLEPSTGGFGASDVDLASVTLQRRDGVAAAIAAVREKSPALTDQDHDGVSEIAITFRTSDLRAMLADLAPGMSDVAFWVRGTLAGGGRFAAPLQLRIDAGKKGLAVAIAPNPLNPTALLTFRMASPGPARVVLFDVAGRVVRVALDDPREAAGYHEVPIGRDAHGRDLPSGVYFYRVITSEGNASGKLVMMK
ncbi:MAG TPA: PKD domain-containing protein [Candidatus Binatia bacterium]|nr:PKD domain-containing protein [Candidatus Binatia bacterium]